MHSPHSVRIYAAVLSVAVLFSLACGPITALGKKSTLEPPQPTATPEPPPTATPKPLPTATVVPSPTPVAPTPTAAAPAGGPTASADADVPEGMDLIPCPKPGSGMILKFSAELRIQSPQADITHSLHDGVLNLMIEQGEDGAAFIQAVEGVSIPYEMNGAMGPCSLTGAGEMSPYAEGFCEEGVVYLIIKEDWGAYAGTLVCPDGNVPLNVPAMGEMTHSGEDGRGEVFYLDNNFSSAGAGYTSIRPFAAGSGEHIWTLFVDATGPVAP